MLEVAESSYPRVDPGRAARSYHTVIRQGPNIRRGPPRAWTSSIVGQKLGGLSRNVAPLHRGSHFARGPRLGLPRMLGSPLTLRDAHKLCGIPVTLGRFVLKPATAVMGYCKR